MKNLKRELPETSIFRSSRSEPGPADSAGQLYPAFGSFNNETLEEYEEPERDTDYFSGYSAEDDDQEDLFPSWSGDRTSGAPGEEPAAPVPLKAGVAAEEETDNPDTEWLDDDEDYFDTDAGEGPSMPMRLIAIAVVACVLLIVGAYGVLQERAAMQKELRDLRASLATGVTAADVTEARDALRNLQQSYDSLAGEASVLSQENLELKEVIAALENTQAVGAPGPGVSTPSAESLPDSTAATVDKPQAVAPEPVVSTTPVGPWFVNFGSYSSPDMAQNRAAKLSPGRGEVVVLPNTTGDRTYYRVRVVGLNDKKSAEAVARKLESESQVSNLWVGRQ
ncbi:MAG: SPOR domain-containing protein [Halioglobus sp.]|nr:SPOR domain-containing protein [Halioglobus sp.]